MVKITMYAKDQVVASQLVSSALGLDCVLEDFSIIEQKKTTKPRKKKPPTDGYVYSDSKTTLVKEPFVLRSLKALNKV